MNKPKAIGTAAETAVVRYCQGRGFPFAERIALHGALDEGDVALCPGVVLEVKGGARAETASDAVIAAWLDETETERVNRGADVAALVTKRKGKGAPNAGQWWAYLHGWAFYCLAELTVTDRVDRAPIADLPAVRITLAELVALLRAAGYGTPEGNDA